MKKTKFVYTLIFIMMLFNNFQLFSQNDDGPEAPPPASVNQYLLFACLLAIGLGWYALIKRQNTIVTTKSKSRGL